MQQTNAAGGIIALDEADDEDEDEDEEDDSVSGVAAPSSGMRSYSLRAAINGSGLTNPPLPFYNRHHHRQQLRRKRSFIIYFNFFNWICGLILLVEEGKRPLEVKCKKFRAFEEEEKRQPSRRFHRLP